MKTGARETNAEPRDDLILVTRQVYQYIFNESGSQGETGMIKFGSWAGKVGDSMCLMGQSYVW